MTNKEIITNDIKVPNKDMEVLRKHFSHCFDKNGEFQIEKFKQSISENEISFSKENYSMDWLGKSYARLLASDPATTLLKEDKEHNQKPENKEAENLLLKGDNLEVLKHLTNAYNEKIKMIYIDPPYNTGGDGFVYQDDRKFTVEELQDLAGIDKERAQRILDFTQSKSNSHSAWLTFMYPRLYIAKQLLREDGVIFISIDDNEVTQLKLMMDEIFGEENFVDNVIWERAFAPKNDSKYFSSSHDYILVYAKSKESFKIGKLERSEEANNRYKNFDNDLRGRWISDNLTVKTYSEKYDYPIETPSGRIVNPSHGSCWRVSKEKFNQLVKDNRIWFGKDGNNVPRLKRFLSEVQDGMTPITIWKHKKVGHNQEARQELKKLFDDRGYFDGPKPIRLIKRVCKVANLAEDALILDFFAGSGTTGDAVMQLNAEDGGNKKYVLVQLPEGIEKKDKAAYEFVTKELKAEPTIFEITKERLLRAGKKINQELNEKNKDVEAKIKTLEAELPTEETKEEIETLKEEIRVNKQVKSQNNFKVFETMPIWEDYHFEAKELDEQLALFDETKLTEEDLNALLITWKTYDGIALTEDLKEIELSGYKAYYAKEKLYLMDKGFTTDGLKALLERIDSDKSFNPTSIIVFGYHFESKNLRELAENLKSYSNKKNIDIDFITRY